MRIALIGDAESPHLLKWARALAAAPDVDLWVASSRGFAPGFDSVVDAARRLELRLPVQAGGDNRRVLRALPRLARWLASVDADWLHAHYLTSHGALAVLARASYGLRARIVGSAWGSDILVTPQRSAAQRWWIRRVLAACTLCTSDSQHMTRAMHALGASEVMTFPFGLEALPPAPSGARQPWRFFASRALEPVYRPRRVLELFARIAAWEPKAQLVIANDGSLAPGLPEHVRALGLRVGALSDAAQVEFAGRLDARALDAMYARAQWYISLPRSDSVAVSVLEAMAHGCLPLLSDLPANRELVDDGGNGLIFPLDADRSADADAKPGPKVHAHAHAHADASVDVDGAARMARLRALLADAAPIAAANRRWIESHAMFAPAVARFLARLRELGGTSAR